MHQERMVLTIVLFNYLANDGIDIVSKQKYENDMRKEVLSQRFCSAVFLTCHVLLDVRNIFKYDKAY
jgi:hypothetical protein